jgi:hypothetical protein
MKGNNNDGLKKHHFWILAGLAPLLVLLAAIFLITGVSGAIEKKTKEVEDNEKTVASAQAPGTGMINDLEKKKETLGKVRSELWKLNWDKQATYFTWPETPDKIFDKYNSMKFGTKHRDFIENPGLSEKLKPAYADAYVKLGASVAPTKLKGGWEKVLRWVQDWGPLQPESQQLWIVMEDIWMQRALLSPIVAVNRAITEFKPVAPLDNPKKRKFVSRVWELDLEVAPREGTGGGRVIKGKLKNRTGQLHVLGTGSAMRVNVWFDPKATHLPPFELRIEGAGVAGGETIDIPPLPSHVLPPNLEVIEIAKVEPVLDARTVPIRRMDRLAIGYLSSKDYSKELKTGTFWIESATAAPAAAASNETSMTPMSGGSGSDSNPAAATASSGIANGRSGGMRLYDVADGSRKRYLEVTDQLRRVPVAFTVVVDQMYVNDVLIAYANSALRFETSQVHWSRFGESLDDKSPGGAESGDPSSGEYATATGFTGYGLSQQSGGSFTQATRSTATMGSSSSGGSGSYGSGMMMSMGMTGGIPGLGSDTLSGVSEAQANAGLVQLTIYGIVTVYERYDAPATEPGADAPMPSETPMTPEPPKAPDNNTTPMTPAKDAPKEPMKDTPKEAPKDAPKEPAKDTPKEAPKDAPKEPAKQ